MSLFVPNWWHHYGDILPTVLKLAVKTDIPSLPNLLIPQNSIHEEHGERKSIDSCEKWNTIYTNSSETFTRLWQAVKNNYLKSKRSTYIFYLLVSLWFIHIQMPKLSWGPFFTRL